MTKSELKSIIMECLVEEGVIVTEEFDADQAAIDEANFVLEACYAAFDEAAGADDNGAGFTEWLKKTFGPKISKEASEMYSKEVMKSGDQDAAAAAVKKFLEEKYNTTLKGKMAAFNDKNGKKVAIGAGVITAFIAASAAAGIAIAKKKKKDGDTKEEDKKEEK